MFKVGDKVRYLKKDRKDLPPGKIFEVTSIGKNYLGCNTLDTNPNKKDNGYFNGEHPNWPLFDEKHKCNFELVEEKVINPVSKKAGNEEGWGF